MKAKQLTEQLNKVLNEEKQSNFILTNLNIDIDADTPINKVYPVVDTFGYQFEQLDNERITGIIMSNIQRDLLITNENTADIEYNSQTGVINGKVHVEQDGKHFGILYFNCMLWIHPQNL